ncbi:unnamed protein product [Rhizophagus irregularis]|nr:unnamed protein product [Rhizophagus irregularis]
MPSKKYYTNLEKEKIYTIVNIKESIIALKRDVTKTNQNLKTIVREIYYLYNAISSEDFKKMLRSDIDKMSLISHIHLEKEIQFKCKIWHFQDDDDRYQETRYRVMKEEHEHHTVKALIDTTSSYPKNNEYYYSETDDSDSSESDSSKLRKKVKKLKRTVDWIGNYVEEQTGIEPGKELDSSDSDYAPPEKKVKPRRNPVRAVQSN